MVMKFQVGAIAIGLSAMIFAADTKDKAIGRIDEAAKVFQEVELS